MSAPPLSGFVPAGLAARTNVCNEHCRSFQRDRIVEHVKEKLKSFKETQYRVCIDLDVSSERCISNLLSLMTNGRRGWYVTESHRPLAAYLGDDWHICVINEKDYNRVVPGSFRVRLRKRGCLCVLRVSFQREKCVKSLS